MATQTMNRVGNFQNIIFDYLFKINMTNILLCLKLILMSFKIEFQ